jgi:hypothetical protein
MYRMIDGMMNRIKEVDSLKRDIIQTLVSSAQPLSTQDISERLDKPWHSIQTRCLMLQIEGKLNGFRIGRINLWTKRDKNE